MKHVKAVADVRTKNKKETENDFRSLSFLFLKLICYFCNDRTVYLKRSLWTEFLTAEASDTLGAIDLRLIVYHRNCLGGTDLKTLATADTFALFQLGAGRHTSAEK